MIIAVYGNSCLEHLVVILCVFVVLCICCTVYFLYWVLVVLCICCTVCCVFVVLCVLMFFTLDARLLARSQYPVGPATGHFDIGFSWFSCVFKQMMRWFPRLQVATTCFSRSPPDVNLVGNQFHVLYTC
jgi:hypothetical protein